jgi:spore coat protein JB
MTEREKLLRSIQICDFVMNDAALFLDVNPQDAMALATYKKYRDMRNAYAADHAAKYGPLAQSEYDGGERWEWVDEPWPWQSEEA